MCDTQKENGERMAHELLYSGDKQRLLEELATASTSSTRLPALESPEHVEALHELFSEVVGLPKEEEVAPKPKSPRMTHNELKAMKVVSSKVQETKTPLMQRISQAVIRFGCNVQSLFVAPKANATTCKQSGHVCAHCGTKIGYEAAK